MEKRIIIIDNGSSISKAGFVDDNFPVTIFPSIVGRLPQRSNMLLYMEKEKAYVGDSAQTKTGKIRLNSPIEYGIITNWDDMEEIWYHTFYNELRVAPEEHFLLLTEPPLNPKSKRERMTQLMFESFNIKGIFIENKACLSLNSCNKKTGVNVDIGSSCLNIVSIHESYIIPDTMQTVPIGGRDITEYLKDLLSQNEISSLETIVVNDIKEKLCFISTNYDKDYQQSIQTKQLNKTYQHPDGRNISIGHETFKAPEILFMPMLIDKKDEGVHLLTYISIMKANPTIRKELYQNIVLSGGSTLFASFPDRMVKELCALAPADIEVKVIALPDRQNAAWFGGSILASRATFKNSMILKEEYDRVGPSIIHTKCPQFK